MCVFGVFLVHPTCVALLPYVAYLQVRNKNGKYDFWSSRTLEIILNTLLFRRSTQQQEIRRNRRKIRHIRRFCTPEKDLRMHTHTHRHTDTHTDTHTGLITL